MATENFRGTVIEYNSDIRSQLMEALSSFSPDSFE